MNQLNDFLKVIAEGKKQADEKNIGKKLINDLNERIKVDNPFAKAEIKLKEEVKQIEEVKAEEPVVKTSQERTDDVLKYLDSLPTNSHSFQQPQPDQVPQDIKLITEKLKFLEQAIGKIAATGPGSGAAEIYNLDMPTRVVTGDYEINRKDYYIGVNCSTKCTITLPSAGRNLKNGRVVVVKDESGHAQLTPIKIVGTIDNDVNGVELRINNGAIQFIYRDGWRII